MSRSPSVEIELRAAGIPAAEVNAFRPRLREALRRLAGTPRVGFLEVVSRRDLLSEISRYVGRAPRGVTDIVQLGIGGSSLGAQAILRALPPSVGSPRMHLPDNVDPVGFGDLLERLDPRRTLVHVVSKSGGTLETRAQLEALRTAWGHRFDASRLVVTTGPKGELRDLAERVGAPTLTFPDEVPGRYSVFTASGLLLPSLAGIPIGRLLTGARRMERHCLDDGWGGPAARLAVLHFLHDTVHRRPIHVEMIYADALLPLGAWFSQIWAESLGKRGRGPTPVVARGTTDQHSQLQLYIGGPDDKLYTLVRLRRFRRRVRIDRRADPPYLAGRDLGEVMDAEAWGTAEALREKGRPLIDIVLPRLTAEGLGELLLLQQLQTALAGSLYEVDPFTQPGVEAGKRAALRILKAHASSRRRR